MPRRTTEGAILFDAMLVALGLLGVAVALAACPSGF
jgi:hypothetical protein